LTDCQSVSRPIPRHQHHHTNYRNCKEQGESYAKPDVGKCYRCGEPEHKSNQCPKRRQVNMANIRMKTGWKLRLSRKTLTLPKSTESRPPAWYNGCYATKRPRHYTMSSNFLFKVFCQKQCCNLIIDNENCENIVSSALVDYLKLEMKLELQPYTIGWIKKGHAIKITYLCHVPIQLTSFSKILLLVMLSIWMHVTYF